MSPDPSYSNAEIPVVQVSLINNGSANDHYLLGQALAPLMNEGILIIGSGALVHNLGALAKDGSPAPKWATDFDTWISSALFSDNPSQIVAFPDIPAPAAMAHPSPEHLMPLFVCLGAAGSGPHIERLHQSFSYGSISMTSFAFHSRHQVGE